MCCPCFGKAPVNSDEFVCSSFGKEFTEFEYVIENLAIRRAPKKLLDAASCFPLPKLKPCRVTCNKKCGRDFTGYVCKSAPRTTCGPVVEAEDIPADDSYSLDTPCKSTTICPPRVCEPEPSCRKSSLCRKPPPSCRGPCRDPPKCYDLCHDSPKCRDPSRDPPKCRDPCRDPCHHPPKPSKCRYPCRDPFCETCRKSPYKRPCPSCNTYYVETTSPELDDSMIRQILKPEPTYEEGSSKIKVSADIHNVSIEGDKPIKIIPTEIKETIEALKVAKPLHLTSEVPGKNHRSLIRSLSATSCDKETSCNLFDPKAEGDSEENVPKEKEEKLRRFARLMKRNIPSKKTNTSSPSTSESTHFPDIIECDEPADGAATTPAREKPSKSQTLKWRIIINKHKKR